MSHVTLAEAKSYSNIYHAEKDAELQGTLDAAEEYVARFLNYDDLSHVDLIESGDSLGDSPEAPLKPLIKQLVLDAFDNFFQNHGIVVTGTITSENPTWQRAAHLYRRGLGV